MNHAYKSVRGFFLWSGGLLLFATALSKLVSMFGPAPLLDAEDPIWKVSFRYVLVPVIAAELGVAYFCLFSKRPWLPLVLVASLSTNFVIYRAGLFWLGYTKECPCLGNLTDWLHMRPETANSILLGIVAYLVVGSYSLLIWKVPRPSASAMTPQREVDGSIP